MKVMHQCFTQLAQVSGHDLTDEQLAERYQLNPVERDSCIANIYLRYSEMAQIQTRKFWHSLEDRTSMFLEVIYKSLAAYTPGRASYKSLLFSFYKNRIRQEDEYLFARGRKWALDSIFVSGKVVQYSDQDGDMSMLDALVGGVCDEYEELAYSLDSLNLSPNQKRYCELLLNSSHVLKNREAAQELGISESGIADIKKYLRKKLLDLVS